jgi:hypothetical protein
MQCEDCQMPVELIDLKRFSYLMNARGYVILCRDCSEGRGLKWEKGKLCEPSSEE